MGLNGLADLIFGKLYDKFGIPVLSVGILISLAGLPLGFLGGTAGAIASVACWATGKGCAGRHPAIGHSAGGVYE